MNGKPFQGAKRKVDPELLDIFYPPLPPSAENWEFASGADIQFGSGDFIELTSNP